MSPAAGDPGDASTIAEVLSTFEQAGYQSQFVVRPVGELECTTCHRTVHARDARVHAFRRLEGASDPADMLAVVALVCPHCGALGTVVLSYGPAASDEDAAVMLDIDDTPPPKPYEV